MTISYSIRHPAGCRVAWSGSPEATRDFLREQDDWPAGTFEIADHEDPFGYPPRRWGVAVKAPEGNVELVPDRPA
jgi:hypothetical protein